MTPSAVSSTRTRRGLARVGVFGVVVAAIVTVAAGTAFAASGTVHTAGAALNVRSGPHTSSSVVSAVANGTSVTISCQTYGDSVTGTYGTSTVWDKISAGYVSDTYIYTGSDGLVAPLCGTPPATSCSTTGLGDPNSCATAVAWAKSHETTTYHADYYERCDHVVGLAYGFSASGSTTAAAHWAAIPAQYKHAGDTNVPAGGLAFFSGGDGHVMISIGGGNFVSSDIGGNGTLTVTTIAHLQSAWGKPYLGWSQPWFQANH